MTGDQRGQWRKAIASHDRQQWRQRGKRKRGLATVREAGMVRIPPPQEQRTERIGWIVTDYPHEPPDVVCPHYAALCADD